MSLKTRVNTNCQDTIFTFHPFKNLPFLNLVQLTQTIIIYKIPETKCQRIRQRNAFDFKYKTANTTLSNDGALLNIFQNNKGLVMKLKLISDEIRTTFSAKIRQQEASKKLIHQIE
ncbi:hypothetical protein [Pedobacter antarcticus]|uniref:hypothetical protein n=1 Tax=Pedobacter antarcticus TaxID=34086 RepID=UPI00292EA791|nr:hypothetical protein [Pedobacter antarcticus]